MVLKGAVVLMVLKRGVVVGSKESCSSNGSEGTVVLKRINQFSKHPRLFPQEDLENGEEVATCPSCSLVVKVIYDQVRVMLIHTLL